MPSLSPAGSQFRNPGLFEVTKAALELKKGLSNPLKITEHLRWL